MNKVKLIVRPVERYIGCLLLRQRDKSLAIENSAMKALGAAEIHFAADFIQY
ncbi:hypothetical protein METHB2_80020 [Candidatus Methylobacter favarea]|uniref:Uncharacterized protein n=1 Tax=Candidatus Methylobacter favarea TaxID=2707345 RepID=A0A8S0XIU1_9GAMM|nr:hypothetical protein [Candidatus Methylobacter favarea]CAA9892703.1 hypothetical protein METHB2_80020 [Candidatus Methylobacter favarea]